MTEKAVCKKCGCEYTDQGSINQVKEWITEGCAPCPNLVCTGQLEIVTESLQGEKGNEIQHKSQG